MTEAKPHRARRKVRAAEGLIVLSTVAAMAGLTSLIIPEGDVHVDWQRSYVRAKFFNRIFVHVDLEKPPIMTGVTGCVFTAPDTLGYKYRVFSRRDDTTLQTITPFVEWRDGSIPSLLGDGVCLMYPHTDQDKAMVGAIERGEDIDR